MAVKYMVDPEVGGTYQADLYNPTGTVPSIRTLDDFDDAALDLYSDVGALSVLNAFSPQEVSDAIDGLGSLLMGEHPEFSGVQYEAGREAVAESPDPLARMDAVRKFMHFVPYEPRLKALAYHPKLVRVLERIIAGPARLFQDMALLKPPRGGREKPWHQDKAYFDFPVDTRVVGVWIALDEATAENGCMHLLLGSHKSGPIIHWRRRDWQICDTDILGRPSAVAPLPPGGLLLFDGLLAHGTPANHSEKRRRAVQYHYAPASAVETSKDERLAIFGSEGKDVTC